MIKIKDKTAADIMDQNQSLQWGIDKLDYFEQYECFVCHEKIEAYFQYLPPGTEEACCKKCIKNATKRILEIIIRQQKYQIEKGNKKSQEITDLKINLKSFSEKLERLNTS